MLGWWQPFFQTASGLIWVCYNQDTQGLNPGRALVANKTAWNKKKPQEEPTSYGRVNG